MNNLYIKLNNPIFNPSEERVQFEIKLKNREYTDNVFLYDTGKVIPPECVDIAIDYLDENREIIQRSILNIQ